MSLNVKFVVINEKSTNEEYISAATNLVISAYEEEREEIPYLPWEEGYIKSFEASIRRLFDKGKGILAISNNKLIGFIAGVDVEEFWGKCKGIYIPLFGHGAIRENRKALYQGLYEHAADMWVKDSCYTHAITLFPHNQETIDIWYWLGFGLRCVDAIRESKPIDVNNPSVRIKKATTDDLASIAQIHTEHGQYYRKSPIFMPGMENEDSVSYLNDWLKGDNRHLWIAYEGEKALGYMKIQPQRAETFVSEHKDVMNIKGAYVSPNERNSGVGAMLLGEIQNWLMENGYPLCAVDFESINTYGSNFWTKYFTPYTHSVVRRIDERI